MKAASGCITCEKDIEDYLSANPQHLKITVVPITRWIKRQYAVPSGIIDLLGITGDGIITAVEVKNVTIDAKALAQVCRYAYDLEGILSSTIYRLGKQTSPPYVAKIVIGRDIDVKTFREAEALGVRVTLFEDNPQLKIYGPLVWSAEEELRRSAIYRSLEGDQDLVMALQEQSLAFRHRVEANYDCLESRS